jgi:hypothetical protein
MPFAVARHPGESRDPFDVALAIALLDSNNKTFPPTLDGLRLRLLRPTGDR